MGVFFGLIIAGGLIGTAMQNGLESIASAIRCYPHVVKSVKQKEPVTE